MRDKKISKTRTISPYKLDPKSDRYRICPNCEKPHMVIHRTSKFCSDKCADEHHNKKKKIEKEQQELERKKQADENLRLKSALQPVEDRLAKNIVILDNLQVDPEEGTNYLINTLINAGFNFEFHSGQEKLYNISPEFNCHFLLFGPYRLYRTDHTKVLVYKEN
jgi:hypothetical protein